MTTRDDVQRLHRNGVKQSEIARQLNVSRQRVSQILNGRRARDFVRPTSAERARMILEQGGVCPLCLNEPERWMTDHDHKTGRVRGYLCFHCNRQLATRYGLEWHRRVVAYLANESSPL